MLINKVSLQVTVEAVIGGSVVLPCFSAEQLRKPQDAEVHWRHNGSKNVLDIIDGKEIQDPRYNNRVEPFPQEYLRGSFSIKLNNLQHTDAGKYTCLISHSSEYKTVELIINETTTEYGTESPITENVTDQETLKPKTDVLTSLLWVYITVPILIIIIAIIIFCRKQFKTVLFSPVMRVYV